MPGKRNLLKSYHLLVLREAGGFGWQIRYSRHANSVERSSGIFVTQAEAQADGQYALKRHQAAALKGD